MHFIIIDNNAYKELETTFIYLKDMFENNFCDLFSMNNSQKIGLDQTSFKQNNFNIFDANLLIILVGLSATASTVVGLST